MLNKEKIIRYGFIINLPFLILLALSCLSGKLNPAVWWPIALTGLAFPILLLITVVSGITWLFIKPKFSLFCLLPIIINIPNILVTFPIQFTNDNEEKNSTSLRILSWNVNLLNYSAPDTETAIRENGKIFSKLRHINADVICLQEFFTAVIPDKTYNFIDSIRNSLDYPYFYFSRDYPKFDEKFFSGTLILSKYKIIDSNKFDFPNSIPGSIIKASIQYHNDTIDIVSSRLLHINFGSYENPYLKNGDKTRGKLHQSISRLKYSYADKVKQVKKLQEVLDNCKHPSIFAGDLNDIPTSYVYNNVKRNMKDVWLQKGMGAGPTFKFFTNTLRIDFIFSDRSFDVKKTDRIISTASDHYGVFSDMLLKKD